MTTSTALAPAVSADELIRLGLGFRAAKALLSAVELGVFGALAAGPLDGAELAARVGLHRRSARDFLDALVALGLLDRDGSRYRNTPATDAYLDPAKPAYLGDLFAVADARLYPSWGALTAALRTGRPQDEADVPGRQKDPHLLRLRLRARSAACAAVAAALADRFPWTRYGTVLDVGTGEGCVPVHLARRHPHLTGGGYDRPPVRPVFDAYVASAGLTDRLRFHAGDIGHESPPSADVLIVGHVLRERGLEAKLALLSAAQRCLPAGGALVIYDAIIDDARRHNAAGLLAGLGTALDTSHGFHYTGTDCQRWLRSVGFSSSYTEHLTGPHSIVVGLK